MCPECVESSAGALQGTKLGPLFWLFYANYIAVDNV